MSIDIYTNDGIRNINHREIFELSGKKTELQTLPSLTYQYRNPNSPAIFSDAWLQGVMVLTKAVVAFSSADADDYAVPSLSAYGLFNRWQLVLDGVVVEDTQSIDANHTLMCEWFITKEGKDNAINISGNGTSAYELVVMETATRGAVYMDYIAPPADALSTGNVYFRLYLSRMFRYLRSKAFKDKVYKGIGLFEVRLFRNNIRDSFTSKADNELVTLTRLDLSLRIPEPQLSNQGELALNKALQSLKTLQVLYEHWQHFRSSLYQPEDNRPNWKVNTLTYKPKKIFIYGQFGSRVNRTVNTEASNPYRPDNLYFDNVIVRLNSQEYPMNGGLRRLNGLDDVTEFYQHYLKSFGVGVNKTDRQPYFSLADIRQTWHILALDLDYDLDEIFKLNSPVDLTIQCAVYNSVGGAPANPYHLNAVIVSDRLSEINFANGQVVNIV